MSSDTKRLIKESLNDYFVPMMVSIIFFLVSGIGYFSKNAYDDIRLKQEVLINGFNRMDKDVGIIENRVSTLEKNEDKKEDFFSDFMKKQEAINK